MKTLTLLQAIFLATEVTVHLYNISINTKRAMNKGKNINDTSKLRHKLTDTSKFEKISEDPSLKREASLQHFLHNFKQKNFLTKMNLINCILLVLLLLVSMVLLKYTHFRLVFHFLHFVQLFLI